MERWVRAGVLTWFVALAVGPACGGDEGANRGTGADPDAADATAGDAPFVPGGDGAGVEVQFPETSPVGDAAPGDADPTGADATPAAGGFGAACNEQDDCNSGWCIDGPEGPMCSQTCIETCPDGYACKNVSGAGSDPTFICVSLAVRLCQPCRDNGDCSLTAGDASGNLCLARGDEGSYCGLNCGENGWPCPAGYECATIDGAPAGTGRQCVPADGAACRCNGAGIALGLATGCAVTNEAGQCPGERACGAAGLTACDAAVPVAETCDGHDEDCDGRTDEDLAGEVCTNDNEHGSCPGLAACVGGGAVCEGHIPAPESCNALDDDCDGETDEQAVGCSEFYLDEDEDGVGAPVSRCLCGADALSAFTANDDGDCDDRNPLAKPGAEEACNGFDDDCDGKVDEGAAEGCVSHYYDGDVDGFGTDEAKCLCAPDAATKFTTTSKGDCNDGQAGVNPDAVESCNGLDDDCDQLTDPAGASDCTSYAYDGDNDGWGDLTNAQCLCVATGKYTSTRLESDCDDTNALVNRGGVEVCNGKDDDCDDGTDEGFGDFDTDGLANCIDPDNDNDGDPNESDCKPYDPDVYGWAEEVCDGRDNDCDGTSDTEGSGGCTTFYFDNDNDGHGLADNTKCLCVASGKYTATQSPDCADSDPTVNPAALEVCDFTDNDCDSVIDPEGTTGCTLWYYDDDNDGWGLADVSRCMCSLSGKYRAANQPDCNDANIAVNPGKDEICDGIDNDCDGRTDEGSGDFDGDGSPDCVDPDDDNDGDPDAVDCGPLNNAVRHGATEACDSIDNDCDAQTDEEGATGCQSWYYDNDNDGYGVAANSRCLCAASGKYSTQTTGDCNDNTNTVHPNRAEVCDTVDNNCDGSTDPAGSGGCTTYYRDYDGDNYGDPNLSQCLCGPSGIYDVTDKTDCYDLNGSARPNQTSYFTSHRGDFSFDYNCSGGPEKQFTTLADCPNLCGGTVGWWSSAPACGSSGSWMDSCYYDFFCDPIYCCTSSSLKTQACR